MPKLEIIGLNLTFVGDFNPSIFHPSWYAAEGLITKGEAQNEVTQLVLIPGRTQFRLPWATFYVDTERLVITSMNETRFEALRDLAVSTFKLLRHTPVTKLGINVERHYAYENLDLWNNFGHKLAPKEIWRKVMKDPGLVSMRMLDKEPRISPSGCPQVTLVDIQSSPLVKPGIFFIVNSHYDCDQSKPYSAVKPVQILETDFEGALARPKTLIEEILSQT